MADHGIERVQGRVEHITPHGVEVALPDGAAMELAADTVVMALGLRPDMSRVQPLVDVIPESYLVGDCNNGKGIFDAHRQAFDVAVEV